jgi:hypothetical protein
MVNCMALKHVFLCLTPFHCHVAVSVAKKRDVIKEAVFVIVTGGEEKSFSSPISRLIRGGGNGGSIVKIGRKEEVKSLLYFLRYRGSVFYSANIKKLYTRLVIKFMNPSQIITFDDGFANVSGAGYFYTKDASKIKRLVLSIVGMPDYDSLVSKVSRHFSIYPNLDNVYNVTDCIGIGYSDELSEEKRKLNEWYGVIFVGSPLFESGLIDVYVEANKIAEAISGFEGRALYLCHPRDSQQKINLIRTRLPFLDIYRHDDIAEVLLVEEKENIGCVVGFFSSTLLNIAEDFPGRVYGKRVEVVDGCALYSKMIESGISVLN